MSSQTMHIGSRVNIFKDIELWLLDCVIFLLSKSELVRSFIRGLVLIITDRKVYLWTSLFMVTCFFGVISGYLVRLIILR